MADELALPNISGQGPAPRGGYNAAGPDYRQLERPAEGISAYHLHADTGMAAAELSRVFKNFESGGINLQDKIQSKLGQQEGAQAGMDPNFQPKTGLASITAYGSAYDAAAHVSYVNGTHVQIESALSKAEQDNAGDPVGFQQHAQAVGDAILKQAPVMYKPEIANALALRTAAGVSRTREQAIQTARSDAFESYTSSVDSRIDSTLQTAATMPHEQQGALLQQALTDDQTQRDALVKARAITPERSAVLGEDYKKRMGVAVQKQYTSNTVDHFMDLARAGDVDSADHALKQYISDPRNSDADKEAVTKGYLEQADKFHQVQARVYSTDVAKLGQSLVGDEKHPGAYGRRVEDQIHQLYKIGAVSPDQMHSLMDQSMRNQVQSIKDDTDNLLVDAAVHGGPKLDPMDKKVQAAADKYFQAHNSISAVPPLSDTWTVNATAFARQTNIIPKSAQSAIRVGLISGDPDTAVRAAAAGERIRSANPQIDPYAADPRSAAIAHEINENLHAGMAPKAAYQTAVMTVDRPKDQKENIDKAYKAAVKKEPNGNAAALQSEVDTISGKGFFGSSMPIPTALHSEYDRLVGTYYALNQDMGKARTLAAQQVQTTWGVSKMNGTNELVKYPPERLGVAPDVLRADLKDALKDTGYTGDVGQVRLVTNSATDASQGRIWSVQHVDPKSGVPDVLLGKDNQPLVYHVPQGQDFSRAQQSLNAEKIAAARDERVKDRATRAEQIQGEKEMAEFYLGTPAGRAAMAH